MVQGGLLPNSLWRRRGKDEHDVVTPEGVVLTFRVADMPTRLCAFVIDFIVLMLILVLFRLIAAALASVIGENPWTDAVSTVVGFVTFNFYFMISELSRQGTTFGKRVLNLRVIADPPGPLTATAVLARNLTRVVELWLPLILVVGLARAESGTPWTLRVLSAVWGFLVTLFPFFNRGHLRPGDLIAGTIVVRAPVARLLPDPASARPRAKDADARTAVFTREELSHYGIYELHVLEMVLREATMSEDETRRGIAVNIAKRIGRTPPRSPAEVLRFLTSFYSAQRAHLEQEMLFGRKKVSKEDGAKAPKAAAKAGSPKRIK